MRLRIEKCPYCKPHTGLRRLLFWRTIHKLFCPQERAWRRLGKVKRTVSVIHDSGETDP